jgi:hypothetical protein
MGPLDGRREGLRIPKNGDDSDEEMSYTMRIMDKGAIIRCSEFSLLNKQKNKHMFQAYANQEVTDFFQFNDREGMGHKDQI